MEPGGNDRPWPPRDGDELASLLGFLDYQRATFAWKCAGLSDDQTSAAEDTGDDLRALWSGRVDQARAAVESQLASHGSDALGATHPAWLGPVSLRWVILHMIEEYARHNGHADLIRESIDGQTGE